MTKFITNQNIEIKLELAGLGDRILAFLIDALIIGVYLITIGLIFASAGGGFSVAYFISLLPVMFYSLVFEIFADGQTPGKMQRNIKVVRLDGGSPEIVNYLMRWILRPIDILFYGCVAMISIMVTQNGQRLGDLAAGTTVIKQRARAALSDVSLLKKDPGYQVSFPQVKRLNDKQVDLIRRTLQMRKAGLNRQATEELDEKIRFLLKIEQDIPPVKLLYTIVKDYEHLHS